MNAKGGDLPEGEHPQISLVMPSYNQAQFLEAAIQSVLDQEYPELEFLIRDGGSTDESVEIIKDYEEKVKSWASEPDGGQAAAINQGWEEASGEILGWLNSDDVLAPGALHRVARAAQERPDSVLFFGDCAVIDEEGRQKEIVRKNGFDRDALLLGKSFAQPSVFIRRCVIEELGLLDSSLHYAMDWSYFLKVLWSYPESKIHYIPAVLSGSREYEGTKSRTGLAEEGQERREKLQKYFEEGTLPKDQRLVNRGLSGTYWKQGTTQFLAGKYGAACLSGMKAVYYAPSTLLEKVSRLPWIIRERASR
jgi:glycosyltransferase involved in cell wall biosynthesis